MAAVQVSDDEIQAFFDRALELVKEAGVVVSEAISLDKEISTKLTDCDVVTLTDKAVEKMLFDAIYWIASNVESFIHVFWSLIVEV